MNQNRKARAEWEGAQRQPQFRAAARYEQAQKMQRASLIHNSKTYFNPWESIFEANPQRILERGESVILPPMFILQGELDDNVLPTVQEHFVATYRAAGRTGHRG